MYQMFVKKILMAIKYINIFQSKALQICPNWDFWYEKKPSGNPAIQWRNSKLFGEKRISRSSRISSFSLDRKLEIGKKSLFPFFRELFRELFASEMCSLLCRVTRWVREKFAKNLA
jgi:hypothetical protein